MRRIASPFLLLLLPLLLSATAGSAGAADDERVGAETCAFCHEETVAEFARTIHGSADPEGSCEGCHGPGGSHADSEGDASLIRSFEAGQAPADTAAACLECHDRRRFRSRWRTVEHARAGLGCTDCHAAHDRLEHPALLVSEPTALCLDCHAGVRAEFALPESHPVERGTMTCSDCHDPHGPTDRRTLGGFRQQTCLRCHSEYRGPWFFEHEAVSVEGCTACHAPHGSVNRHLLTYQRVGDLCIQCHAEQPFFHTAVDGAGERTTGINDCTRCHSEIHGSNNDALFLN